VKGLAERFNRCANYSYSAGKAGTLSIPFLWLVLFRPRTPRPALLVIVSYLALTVIAVAFQKFDFSGLLKAWLVRSVEGAARETMGGGYGNVHSWLACLD